MKRSLQLLSCRPAPGCNKRGLSDVDAMQVTPGADASKKESPETVADYTLKLLKRRVPPAVPGMLSSPLYSIRRVK